MGPRPDGAHGSNVRTDLAGAGDAGLVAGDRRTQRRVTAEPRRPATALVVALLLYKAAVLGVPLFYARLSPNSFSVAGFMANFHRHQKPGFAERFSTWDGEHYLFLSQYGYLPGSPSDAFYPLWPAIIRTGTLLTGGHPLIAALLLSNLLSLAGFVALHRLVAATQGTQTADCALALLIAYPGSLFFQFAYSESLFLLLIVLFFIGLFGENYRLVAVIGFFLPLTRATGVFCVLPLASHLWEKEGARHKSGGDASLGRVVLSLARNGAIPALLAPMLGYAAYFGVMAATAGNPFAGFAAQKHYLNQPSIANIVNVPGFVASFFHVGLHHGMADSPIDRAFFVVFVISLPWLWRLNKPYFLYALGSGLAPAMSNFLFLHAPADPLLPAVRPAGGETKGAGTAAVALVRRAADGSHTGEFPRLARELPLGWVGRRIRRRAWLVPEKRAERVRRPLFIGSA